MQTASQDFAKLRWSPEFCDSSDRPGCELKEDCLRNYGIPVQNLPVEGPGPALQAWRIAREKICESAARL